MVGLDRADDAGVYRVSKDLALIQTVDFFTPIVDDPYWFGQIAAANALSDVYAMGGTPKTAMNLVAFPVKQMDLSVLRQIIQGGLDKLSEAEVVLIGGHSIEDKELKYGLSVTGFVHPSPRCSPRKILRPGDRLVLTKPIGTGIINTAIKAGIGVRRAHRQGHPFDGVALNRDAAAIMSHFDVSACTDVTGFGLLGHLAEMVSGSGAKALRVFAAPGAGDCGEASGIRCDGTHSLPVPTKTGNSGSRWSTFADTVDRARGRTSCSTPRPRAAC
jgi:selenide, water dikinase